MSITGVAIVLGAIAVSLLIVFLFAHFGANRHAAVERTGGFGSLLAAVLAVSLVIWPQVAPSPGPSGTPDAETRDPSGPDGRNPTPETSKAPSYRLEHEGVLLVLRTAHDGRDCSPYTAVDFDGGPGGTEFPLVRVVKDDRDFSTAQLDAIDLTYSTCANAQLEVEKGAVVGLLREGAGADWRECAAAASGASIGTLEVNRESRPEDAGFVEGAAICALTDEGRVARAAITGSCSTPGSATASRPSSSL